MTNENGNGTARTVELQGKSCSFEAGETILEVAQRNGMEIPTLCHDPRLDPAGACRTCLVEIEGWRRLAPACATKAEDGMKVAVENEQHLFFLPPLCE